jgi:MFS family permease
LSIGPLAAYRFSKSFVDDRSSLAAALLFVFLPSIRSLVFIFGQFACFVGLVFLLFAVGAIGDFLRTGNKFIGASAVCLVACVVASHHGIAIFLLPPVLVITTIASWRKEHDCRCFIVRSAIILFLCAIAALIVVLPFWMWFLDLPKQVPIPHPSRDNILRIPYILRVFFLDLYGPFLLLAPLAVAKSVWQRNQLLLAATYLLFMILGLGGATPLPALLYGESWQWLTFERFGVWATVLLLPLAGQFIVQVRNQYLFYVATAISSMLVFLALNWLIDPSLQRITPTPIELEPVFECFAEHPICKDRYLALGFDYQAPDLSTFTGAKTLDGLWHTARTDPLLRNSGVGQLSDVLYWSNGAEVLDAFLNRQEPFPAYCIFVNETSVHAQLYREIIVQHDWGKKMMLSNEVSLWMNDSISPNIAVATRTPSPIDKIKGYLWGILPLSSLLLAVCTNAIRWSNICRNNETSCNYDIPAK